MVKSVALVAGNAAILAALTRLETHMGYNKRVKERRVEQTIGQETKMKIHRVTLGSYIDRAI